MRRPSRSAVVVIIAAATAVAQIPETKEQVLGRQLVADAAAPWPAIADPDDILYLGRLIARLTPPEGLRVPLQLRVVSNPDPIASMFPGGFLLLSSGAILRAQSEAELAALLAHEMGHLQERPFTEPAGTTTIPLVFVGGARGAENRSGPRPFAVKNRLQDAETQADAFALDALGRGGYDGRALISVFRGWDAQFPIDESIRARAEASAGTAVVDSSEFQRVVSVLRARLPPTPRPSQIPPPSLRR